MGAGINFAIAGAAKASKAIRRDMRRVKAISDRVTVMALNQTAKRQVETPAVKDIARATKVPQSRVRWYYNDAGKRTKKRRLSMVKASKIDPAVYIWFRRRTFVPAITLGRSRQTKTGVTAGKHNYPGAFIARASNGDNAKQVFKRRGPGRRSRLELKGVHMLPDGGVIMSRYVRQSHVKFRANYERLMAVKLRRK